MKSRTLRTRLGSFEQLESRALLAHGGMNFAVLSFDDFGPRGFSEQNSGQFFAAREFRQEPQHLRDLEAPPRGELPSRAGEAWESRGQFSSPNQGYVSEPVTSVVSSVVIVVPVTPVLVVINVPAPPVQQQFSAPISSNLIGNNTNNSAASGPPGNAGRSTSVVAPPSNFASSLASNSAPRSTPAGRTTLDSLSLVTGLSLKRTDSDTTAADETETTEASADNDNFAHNSTQRENSSAIPAKAADSAAQADDTETAADLIELTAEDPLTRGKRKAVRQATVQRETALVGSALRQRPSAQLQPNTEIWLQAAPTESDLTPVADDLIELLASDTTERTQPTAEARSFDAPATLPIEATVGYFRATEPEIERNATEHAQPAAVAAAALPVPAGK